MDSLLSALLPQFFTFLAWENKESPPIMFFFPSFPTEARKSVYLLTIVFAFTFWVINLNIEFCWVFLEAIYLILICLHNLHFFLRLWYVIYWFFKFNEFKFIITYIDLSFKWLFSFYYVPSTALLGKQILHDLWTVQDVSNVCSKNMNSGLIFT